MQKPSETVYANLFWLISGLLIWLLILPVGFLCLPFFLLRAVWQVLFYMPQLKITDTEIEPPIEPERKRASKAESLGTSFLITTLVAIPASLAAVISLQPSRVFGGEQKLTQLSASQPSSAQGSAEENSGEN